MKRRIASLLAAVAFALPAAAQGQVSPGCQNAGNLQDACQKATDLFKYMSPQLGAVIAGGNTILGQGGALGGLPHFTIGVRGTLLTGNLPKVDQNPPNVNPGTAQASSYTTSTQILGFPAVDGAIGVFGGLPLGLTSVGAVDLLVNAAYVPNVNANNISVAPKQNLQFGVGARLGLLQESILVPGVSVSYIHRGLPTTTITATSKAGSAATDTLQVKDLSLATDSWRLTASKSFILFGLAAGVGQDRYKNSTDIYTSIYRNTVLGVVNPTGTFKADQNLTRTNAFVDGYVSLLMLKIVGELGMVQGGTVNTYNTFDKAADASRVYGAVGLRIGM